MKKLIALEIISFLFFGCGQQMDISKLEKLSLDYEGCTLFQRGDIAVFESYFMDSVRTVAFDYEKSEILNDTISLNFFSV